MYSLASCNSTRWFWENCITLQFTDRAGRLLTTAINVRKCSKHFNFSQPPGGDEICYVGEKVEESVFSKNVKYCSVIAFFPKCGFLPTMTMLILTMETPRLRINVWNVSSQDKKWESLGRGEVPAWIRNSMLMGKKKWSNFIVQNWDVCKLQGWGKKRRARLEFELLPRTLLDQPRLSSFFWAPYL